MVPVTTGFGVILLHFGIAKLVERTNMFTVMSLSWLYGIYIYVMCIIYIYMYNIIYIYVYIGVNTLYIYMGVYTLFLGKLQYFTDLNCSAIWGWFPLLTMISSEVEEWGRYNLPRLYIYIFISESDLCSLWSMDSGCNLFIFFSTNTIGAIHFAEERLGALSGCGKAKGGLDILGHIPERLCLMISRVVTYPYY